MPKQLTGPSAPRALPSISYPKQFWLFLPSQVSFFPGRLPAPPCAGQELPRGTKAVTLRPLSLLSTNSGGSREKRPRPRGPLPRSPGNPRGFRCSTDCDPRAVWSGSAGAAPRGPGVAGRWGALRGTAGLQSGPLGKYFRGTCSGGRSRRPGGWNPPLPGALLLRAGPGGGAAAVI